jgi:hypothetical protein
MPAEKCKCFMVHGPGDVEILSNVLHKPPIKEGRHGGVYVSSRYFAQLLPDLIKSASPIHEGDKQRQELVGAVAFENLRLMSSFNQYAIVGRNHHQLL